MNKNKINPNKISKYLARLGLIIMAFVIMIPMLCSAAAPTKLINVTIQNPDNIPQDIDFSLGSDTSIALNFGDNVVDSFLISVLDSKFELGSFEFITDVPDGDYYYAEIRAEQTSGYSNSLVCNGHTFTVTNSEFLEYPSTVYVTDNPVITVIDSNDSFTLINISMFIPVHLNPTPTESITNVWSDMLNWFTSALNSVTSLFVTQTTDNTVLPGTYTFDESFDGDFPDYIIDENVTDYDLNYSYNGYNYSILACGCITASAGSSSSIVNMLAFGTYDNPEPLIIYSYSTVNGEVAPSGNGYQVDTPVQITISAAQSVSPLMMQILSDYTDYDSVNVSSGYSYELTPIGILVILPLVVAISLLILRRVVMYFQLH